MWRDRGEINREPLLELQTWKENDKFEHQLITKSKKFQIKSNLSLAQNNFDPILGYFNLNWLSFKFILLLVSSIYLNSS